MSSNYQYHFTKKAKSDLDEILSYISVKLSNPECGFKLFKRCANSNRFYLFCA